MQNSSLTEVEVGGQIVEARRDDDAFIVCAADGRAWSVERLMLATGVRDVYPDIEGFFDFRYARRSPVGAVASSWCVRGFASAQPQTTSRTPKASQVNLKAPTCASPAAQCEQNLR
jgi:hypothetical protein